MPSAQPPKPTFEEAYPEIASIVAKRRRDWTYLSILPWEDVSQMILLRLYTKWDHYNPTKAPKLEHWVNTVITHALLNLKRDLAGRYARPCIGGGKSNGKSCTFNQGGDSCTYTSSGTQCSECPLYAEWVKKRQPMLHIQSNVALENHSQEVSNIQDDFIDTNQIKDALDVAMLAELSRWEGKVYKCLFQRHLSPTDTCVWLLKDASKRKRPLAANEQASYSAVLILQREFKGMMKEWLRREGHI
jgi:hypothetical protein